KANFDEESSVEGILLDVFFEEGDDVPVLTNICVIGDSGESTEEFNPAGRDNAKLDAEVAPVEETVRDIVAEAEDKEVLEDGEAGKVKISPRAKGLAKKSGISYENAIATGPHGRIIERDILDIIAKRPSPTYAAKDDLMNTEHIDALVGTGIGGRVTTLDIATAAMGDKDEQIQTDVSEVY